MPCLLLNADLVTFALTSFDNHAFATFQELMSGSVRQGGESIPILCISISTR